MEQRFLTDEELQDAKALFGLRFWLGPLVATICFFACAWLIAGEKDVEVKTLVLGILGVVSASLWLVSIRQYKRFAADIQTRVLAVVIGAPERVRLTKTGRCYVRLEGRDVCVPNEYYKELQDANAARIEFLPRSRLATRVKIIRGLGLNT
jgi:hypothetical protein